MTSLLGFAEALPDDAPSPADLLDRLAAARHAADDAEREILVLAVAWAHAHPERPDVAAAQPGAPGAWQPGAGRNPYVEAIDNGAGCWLERDHGELSPTAEAAAIASGGDAEAVEWADLPTVEWSAPAAFAAANAMTTAAGKAVIRDALLLAHRMPHTWQRVLAGELTAWRARRIAQTALGSPRDVITALDAEVAPQAHSAGPVTLTRLLDAAMLRLHVEARELAQLEALDARFVTVHTESIGHTGIVDLHARGDYADLHDLDQTLDQLADALAGTADDPDTAGQTHAVRRAIALGLLAHPRQALDLLDPHQQGDQPGQDTPIRERTTLHVHLHANLADLAVGGPGLGLNPVADMDGLGPVLDAAVRTWCARPDLSLTVQPILDTRPHHAEESGYRPTARLRADVEATHPTCTFPWCSRASRTCDLDHTHPWDADDPQSGPTCWCNLIPLCRHHHLLKTHTSWTYQVWDPALIVWTDPHHRRYLRTPQGTHALSLDPAAASPPPR